jgi:hypothetical protein
MPDGVHDVFPVWFKEFSTPEGFSPGFGVEVDLGTGRNKGGRV